MERRHGAQIISHPRRRPVIVPGSAARPGRRRSEGTAEHAEHAEKSQTTKRKDSSADYADSRIEHVGRVVRHRALTDITNRNVRRASRAASRGATDRARRARVRPPHRTRAGASPAGWPWPRPACAAGRLAGARRGSVRRARTGGDGTSCTTMMPRARSAPPRAGSAAAEGSTRAIGSGCGAVQPAVAAAAPSPRPAGVVCVRRAAGGRGA